MVTVMKKIFVLIQLCFFLTLSDQVYSQIDTLTILHLNDTHSCLAPLGPRDEQLKGTQGGIARAATIIKNTKSEKTNVLTLHAGDMSIGDILFNNYFIIPELQIMESLGFDAVVLGNHEFDLTPITLLYELLNLNPESSLSILGSNLIIDDPSLQQLRGIVKNTTIKEFDNLKVGIFGLTTPETNLFSQPAPVVVDTNLLQISAQMINSLKAENCDFIICLSHLGFNIDKLIAENIPDINLIVGAHDHFEFVEPKQVKNPFGDVTYIVQAGAFYKNIGKIQFLKNGAQFSLLDYSLINLDQNVEEDFAVKMQIDELIIGVEQNFPGMFTEQITFADDFFEEVVESPITAGDKDTPVGNLLTDAYRFFTHTCITFIVGGSTAQPLYAGPLVPADIYRTISYGFNENDLLDLRIVTFDITGEELTKAFNFVLAQIDENDEYLPQVSGMRYEFDATKPKTERLTKIFVNDLPITSDQIISATTNEMLLLALTDLFGITISNVYAYDEDCEFSLACDYISPLNIIYPFSEGRVVEIDQSNYTITKFGLEQNYPNPFNPSTTIQYQIKDEDFVTLKVFNVLGEEIEILVSEIKKPGNYKITFPQTEKGISSGVYFYRLETSKNSITKKMILIE